MRVLVIGSGAREHALCWKLAASPLLTSLCCVPGNPGIAAVATCLPGRVDDIAGLVALARREAIDLVVPGPEGPLVAGIVDAMEEAGIRCFGPSAAAARLEGSKSFTKEICAAAGIPTAAWRSFTDAPSARAYLATLPSPPVVKADGLAAGKGVVVAATHEEAEVAITEFLEVGRLGAAGRALVLEERLTGEEVSLFALCDGEHAIAFGAAQDHKAVGEGDTGPNTGGMGAYSPPPVLTAALEEAAMQRIVRPALAEMARRGTPFRGILFAGLMLTAEGPKLIEFNVRFGDPECEALMLRLRSDLLAALLAAMDGELPSFDVRWSKEAAMTVVMAARGYPARPASGGVIGGLEAAGAIAGAHVFHASTATRDGVLVAQGGRVLAISAAAATLAEAARAAYAAVDKVVWADGFCRRDIGWRALGGVPT
ncbi:MAG: phosphoribosylamine--glycine ligase [Rhodospirillales bacterium]|nr:phosphoribosylamine--glycine ligase [Rhodospirillales bacterium]